MFSVEDRILFTPLNASVKWLCLARSGAGHTNVGTKMNTTKETTQTKSKLLAEIERLEELRDQLLSLCVGEYGEIDYVDEHGQIIDDKFDKYSEAMFYQQEINEAHETIQQYRPLDCWLDFGCLAELKKWHDAWNGRGGDFDYSKFINENGIDLETLIAFNDDLSDDVSNFFFDAEKSNISLWDCDWKKTEKTFLDDGGITIHIPYPY